MRKTLLYSVVSFLFSVIVFTGTSCKKSESARDKLIGIWYDVDNNTITFNSDGTGQEYISSSGTGSFTWTMPDDNDIVFANGNTWEISWENNTNILVEDKGNNNYSFNLVKH